MPLCLLNIQLMDAEGLENELRKLYQGVDVQANGPEIGRRFFELLTEDFVLPPVAGKP